MLKALRTLLIACALFACYAAGVIWYWQSTARVVSGADIFIYLLLIPAAALLLWAVVALILARRRKAAAAAAAAAPAVPAQADTGRTVEIRYLDLYAAGCTTPLGDDAASLVGALQESPVPELDTQLFSEDGIPLRARRCVWLDDLVAAMQAEADSFELDDEPQSIDAQRRLAHGGEHGLRAWLLLQSTLDRLYPLAALGAGVAERRAAAAPRHTSVSLHPAWSGDPGEATETAPRPTDALPRKLPVALFVDATLGQIEQDALRTLLEEHLEALGLTPDFAPVSCIPCRGETAVYDYLAGIHDEAQTAREPGLWLLLSAGSSVSPLAVEQREMEGRLQIVKGTQTGFVPGEAAAAVLLGTGALRLPDAPAQTRLSPLAQDESEHADAAALARVWERLNDAAPLSDEALGCALSGCEAFGRPAAEFSRFAVERLPRLMEAEKVIQLGSAWGDCEPAGALATLAVAAEMARDEDKAVLIAANAPRLKPRMGIVQPQPRPETDAKA